MGTSLTGLTPSTTYDALIKVGDNGPITSTLKTLSDGLGNDLPMEASTTAINFTNQLQQSGVAVPTASQVNAKQDTLVSGTNIKTINGTSLLGSGNIPVVTSPSGVAGAIQFSDGSAFASDAANLFWNNTTKRLGIGTNAPTTALDVNGSIRAGVNLTVVGEIQNPTVGVVNINGELRVASPNVSIGLTSYPARLAVRGSGSTSATTSLLVQNSSGDTNLIVTDDQIVKGYAGSSIRFRFGGNSTAGISTRIGPLCIGIIDAGFSSGLQISADSSNGKTFINGWNDGGSNQYDIVIGNEGSRTQFGTNSASVSSAQVAINSTTRGFLPPRMTTTQKNAIATPAAGLVVYDSTTNKLCCYDGSTWNDLF